MAMKADADDWRACFAAAIAGIVAGHRILPNAGLVVKFAAEIADRALPECRRRRKAAPRPRRKREAR